MLTEAQTKQLNQAYFKMLLHAINKIPEQLENPDSAASVTKMLGELITSLLSGSKTEEDPAAALMDLIAKATADDED